MDKFNLSEFLAPPREYAPMYGWCWNGPISKEETLAQINKMRDFGIKAFYILPESQAFRPNVLPTRMDPNYMTEAYLEQYKYAIDLAREYGMECWIYDEDGWPSGGACGQVMREYPEYARRTLNVRKMAFKAGESFRLSDSDAAAAFLDGVMLSEGYVFESDAEVDEYYSERIAWRTPGVPDIPDLTRREATDAFIRFTHEKYKKALGEHIGTTLTAVFTDEPEAPQLPFRDELCKTYEEEHGESILPYLPALLDPTLRDEESNIRVRRWYDMCSRLFSENFIGRCSEWARENGMRFTGHLNLDNEPAGCMRGKNFHLMRGLRAMDIPGVDVIWRQIFPGEPYEMCDPTGKFQNVGGFICCENRFFPRYASSAAAQTGGKFAMTELYGVYGSGMTYDQMRYVAGFHAVRGVALFNPLMIVYYRRGHLMTGELPAFAEYHACSADLGVFNKYLERLSYVSTIGERVSDVALYYPINNYWVNPIHNAFGTTEIADEFEALGKAMEERGIDFDIVDDDVIAASAEIDNGIIRMGNACYKKIVIERSAYLPEKTVELLERFRLGGGEVYYSVEEIESEVKLVSGLGKLRTMKRRLDNGELILLFNEDISAKEVKLAPEAKNVYLINVEEGRVLSAELTDGVLDLTLGSGETAVILLSSEELECESVTDTRSAIVLDSFTFRRTNSFVIEELDLCSYDIDEAAEPIELGPWAERVGIEFSGSGIYETSFKMPSGNAVLDLGDVRYTCEVFVNGESLGTRVMPPYRYELPSELLREENKLEIRVSNTPGNQMQFTKAFDKYGEWQLTSYHKRQLIFDRDTLESGLFGPVKICF